jgi:DNA integrity scanning protein DisA with diadenylate cyclase activity
MNTEWLILCILCQFNVLQMVSHDISLILTYSKYIIYTVLTIVGIGVSGMFLGNLEKIKEKLQKQYLVRKQKKLIEEHRKLFQAALEKALANRRE